MADETVKALPERVLAFITEHGGWDAALAYVEQLRAEVDEQSRLNGMGSEREARLMARVSELEREVERLGRDAADAARYRFLRDKSTGDDLQRSLGFVRQGGGAMMHFISWVSREELDAAIDQQINVAATQEPPHAE